ncbi:hypothetical protein TELCIR_05819 [Teladorsagia circumcincta]|uniref:Uncharacterized protein n=1 Tax=Teladorsagia circumcincta TaxID=45464 RepID=A0A2G9UPT6_TELCI|nr:hypothetical protein TELCIR_05819 [Teladorsagia circumcincta]
MRSAQGITASGNIDPDDAFKYVMRESDGFRKGYKAVKVSVVCKHPITRKLVAVVVFVDPSDGHEFAQYIPLRETHANAPTELRQYFVAASGCTDPKKLVLHLLLQLPNKAP